MRTKLVVVGAIAFLVGGIAVGVLLIRGGPGDSSQVNAAEPDKNPDEPRATARAKNLVVEEGPLRGAEDQFKALYVAQSVRRVTAEGSQYGVKFGFIVGDRNAWPTMTATSAEEMVAVLKRMIAAKKPDKAVAQSRAIYLAYQTLDKQSGTYGPLTLFDTKANESLTLFVGALEAALKDIEAMKKEEPAFVP